jgi:RNA polymerase sigma-70 factor, ECF subfamily
LDEANFEILFKNNFKELCRFASKYIKDVETVKEIVQDTFVNLWSKKESLDMNLQIKSYLITSVKNRCLNYIRNNKKFIEDFSEIENYDIEYEENDFLIEEELNIKIESSIAELPQKCKEIFIMNRYENLKYLEIADKLSISVKTVEAHMSKALKHMRIKLAEYIKK